MLDGPWWLASAIIAVGLSGTMSYVTPPLKASALAVGSSQSAIVSRGAARRRHRCSLTSQRSCENVRTRAIGGHYRQAGVVDEQLLADAVGLNPIAAEIGHERPESLVTMIPNTLRRNGFPVSAEYAPGEK